MISITKNHTINIYLKSIIFLFTKFVLFIEICSELKPGVATMICFLGLDASKEELGILLY